LKILIIGGTRMLGKKIFENLYATGEHSIVIISRRLMGELPGCRFIEAERSAGILQVTDDKFNLILDFISYDDTAVAEVVESLAFDKYILISSCWMVKLNNTNRVDEFIDTIDENLSSILPAVTQKYLLNKRAAENYLKNNLKPGRFHIIRLPIFWGEADHTRRLEFYVSRLLDSTPIILVDGAQNICQIGYVNDLGAHLVRLFTSRLLVSQPILEALPDNGEKVIDVLRIIAQGIDSKSPFVKISIPKLKDRLPDYLDQEPLWRENSIVISQNNIYKLLDSRPTPITVWLPTLSSLEARKMPKPGAFRESEKDLISELIR